MISLKSARERDHEARKRNRGGDPAGVKKNGGPWRNDAGIGRLSRRADL